MAATAAVEQRNLNVGLLSSGATSVLNDMATCCGTLIQESLRANLLTLRHACSPFSGHEDKHALTKNVEPASAAEHHPFTRRLSTLHEHWACSLLKNFTSRTLALLDPCNRDRNEEEEEKEEGLAADTDPWEG
eukprot:5432251-Amphidinium_carterae.1